MNKLYDIVWWDPIGDPVTTGPFSYGEAHTLMAYKVPHRTMVMVDHPPDAEEPDTYARHGDTPNITFPAASGTWGTVVWPDMDNEPAVDYLSLNRRAAGF